jgi:molecular chaperone DnaK (HSP70)
MKLFLFTVLSFCTFASFGQVKATEEAITFSNGTHNAIVVTVPNGTLEGVSDELKSEMKNWGGKFDEKKGEYTAIGASMKKMGDKPFDGYAKVIENGKEIKVAFSVDLGGAYMSSSDHSAQYKVMLDRAKEFSARASTSSINGILKAEEKILKSLSKEQSDFEKDIEKSQSEIEKAKKTIEEEEKKIVDNKAALEKKTAEVKAQELKISDIEKKK